MSRINEQYYIGGKHVRDIDLKDYFTVIKKRLWIIVMTTIIIAGAGYLYSNLNNSPVYQTSTRMIVEADKDYMTTLMVMIKDPVIMEKVKEDLHLTRSAEQIAGQVEVTQMDESQVIRIGVTDKDPKLAMDIANATAAAFKSKANTILKFDNIQLLSAAKENYMPMNKSKYRLMIIGALFGLATGIGLAFLLDSLDSKVRMEWEVEEITGVPVLGVVSNMNKRKFVGKKVKPNERRMGGETVDIK